MEVRLLVGSTDFDRSCTFYAQVLGFDLVDRWSDQGGRGALFRATDEGIIEVFEDSVRYPFRNPSGIKIAIEVADVALVFERVLAGGVEVVTPVADHPWGHRNFEILDPDGLSIVFFTVLQSEAQP